LTATLTAEQDTEFLCSMLRRLRFRCSYRPLSEGTPLREIYKYTWGCLRRCFQLYQPGLKRMCFQQSYTRQA